MGRVLKTIAVSSTLQDYPYWAFLTDEVFSFSSFAPYKKSYKKFFASLP